MSDFEFPKHIYFEEDPTLTVRRIEEYSKYYPVKYEICKKQAPSLIVEIGVRCGYSAWTFLQAAPEAKYYGFDANNGTHGGAGGQDGRFARHAELILSFYDVKLVQLDTQTVVDLPFLEEESVDFFHVDGDHTVLGVQHDLDLAFKYISDTGLILVDDYDYLNEVRVGVDAWLKGNECDITFEYMKSLRGEILIRKK